MKKWNEEKILEEIKARGYYFVEGDLSKTTNKITLKKDNFIGTIAINKFIFSKQEVCFMSKSNSFSIINIKKWLELNNPNLEIISNNFLGGDNKLQFRCKYHKDKEYYSTWQNVKAGYSCPICAGIKKGDCRRTDYYDVVNKFKEYELRLITPIYKNRNQKIIVQSREGYIIETNFATSKQFAPHPFAIRNRFTTVNIKKWIKNNGLPYILLSEFEGADKYLILYCKRHKKQFCMSWNNLSSGKRCYECSIEARSGVNAHNYNPNLTDEERELKRYYIGKESYGKWRKSVFEKDNYSCDICGLKGRINAHHLDGWNWCRDKRTDIDNGITLCENHHKEFHKIYGSGNNTKEQYEDFKKNIKTTKSA